MTNALLGYIKDLIVAVIAMAIGFGWIDWTPDQIGLVLGVYVVLASIIQTINTYVSGKARDIREAAQSTTKIESVPKI